VGANHEPVSRLTRTWFCPRTAPPGSSTIPG